MKTPLTLLMLFFSSLGLLKGQTYDEMLEIKQQLVVKRSKLNF